MMIMVRNVRPDELNEVLRVEAEAWPPEIMAPIEKFESRMRIFPEGFFGAYEDGKLVGVSTSQIISYPVDNPKWESITDNGFIRNHNPNGNALYVVSVGVSGYHQGKKVGTRLVEAQKDLVKRLGLEKLVLGARIPQYRDYVRSNGEISAEDYVNLERDDNLPKDIELRFYWRSGLRPVKVVPKFMDDDPESLDYGVVMAWDNIKN